MGFLSAGPASPAAERDRHFGIHAIDDATGRGVPLVTLETTNRIALITDSSGWAAFDEPGLMSEKVHFTVTSPGYAFQKDGFGFAGITLTTTPGTTREIKVMRLNIAERIYRVTGQGIYRDSSLLGTEAPLPRPNLNGGVMGQDSVQVAPYRGRLFWIWGDTVRPPHPLGNFHTTAAISDFPDKGGLDPGVGVHLDYLLEVGTNSVRRMVPLDRSGMVWLDGMLTIKNGHGEECLLAHYSRMKSLGERLEHGIVEFNDETGVFEPVIQLGEEFVWQCPRGHPVRVSAEGTDHFYFADPFCTTRVPADYDSILNPSTYEALALDESRSKLVWQTRSPPISQANEAKWVKEGKLDRNNARLQVVDAASSKPVTIYGASIQWNQHRKRWILIGVQHLASESPLGEVWYAESPNVDGPWSKAVKVATHPNYSFYNPCHHPYFDQEGGRVIYFEGTYTHTFSGNPVATPRYDYNQVMYRLDLDDPRLVKALEK